MMTSPSSSPSFTTTTTPTPSSPVPRRFPPTQGWRPDRHHTGTTLALRAPVRPPVRPTYPGSPGRGAWPATPGDVRTGGRERDSPP
jgi:hypothetical protein